MIPFPPYEPDKGPFSATSTDGGENLLPISNGWAPMPSLVEAGSTLGGKCFGAWWYRNTAGSFGFIAATKTAIFRRQSNGTWTNVSKVGGYIGPDDGELWQAERFGTRLYLTNINDPLQFIDVDSGTVFADEAGSPPQAKYIETVGDFLFLASLKKGADQFPQDWQHSKINDPTNWSITGVPGDSDRQTIPDGDEIVSIFASPGGCRIIQKRAKRRLIFTPGSDFSFQMSDIDATRGAVAPYAVVPIGGDSYLYPAEDGIYINDTHSAIGAERVDRTIYSEINLDKLVEMQGVADPAQKIVWLTYETQSGERRTRGWHWQLDRWTTPINLGLAPYLLVSAVSIGAVLNDLDVYGTLDSINIPLDSRFFKGGRVTFGAFTLNNKLAFFAGTPAAATAETATVELTPETGSFVTGAKLKGDPGEYTIQVGGATLPDTELTWSAVATRSPRTGMVSFRKDGKLHRFRANITAASDWSHLHGVSPYFRQSGFA